MAPQPVKKKRFEGLIQFQDPLRQALVCLQAALKDRFVTGSQLEYLKAKDSRNLSHFLSTADGSQVGGMPAGLEARHILMRVEQIENHLPSWKTSDSEAKIFAWLDSSDPLTAQYFFQLLAQAVAEQPQFDLSQICSWGAAIESWQNPAACAFHQSWLNAERVHLLSAFKNDAGSLFTKVDKQSLTTDGCSVSLLLEGETELSWDELSATALKKLGKANRHLIAVNYASGPRARLQCAYLTPMRLPLKDLQTLGLKAFLLVRDIKETAKRSTSVLAS